MEQSKLLLKILQAKLLLDTASELSVKTEEGTRIIEVSERYGIYGHNNEPKNIPTNVKLGKNNNFKTFGFDAGYSIEELAEKLISFMKEPMFFGAIVHIKVDGEKKLVPYNPLSLSFIQRYKAGKIDRIEKMFFYLSINNNAITDDEVIKEYEADIRETLDQLDVLTLEVEERGNNTSYIKLMAPRDGDVHYEELGLHLDNLHQIIPYSAVSEDDMEEARKIVEGRIIVTSNDLVLNAIVSDSNVLGEDSLNGSWAIEHSVIYTGITLPSYGIWRKANNKTKPATHVTNYHPNISVDGRSICTGINDRNTFKGISELSYGNLTSPLNASIGIKDSLSIAKAYQRVYIELLLSIEIKKEK